MDGQKALVRPLMKHTNTTLCIFRSNKIVNLEISLILT